MRKKIVLLFILVLMIVGCNNEKKNVYKGYSIEVDYCGEENMINSDELFFDSFDEYDKYMFEMRVCGTESIHDKYDKKYFEDKSLAIVYVVTGSGGTRVVYKDYEILDNKIKINYEKKNSGGISTDDMHGFYVVVEVPKNIVGLVK